MFKLVPGRLSRWITHPLSLPAAVLVIILLPFAVGEYSADVGARVQTQENRWTVAWVDQGGIADRSGLREGDVVLALDGEEPRMGRLTDPGLDIGRSTDWTVLRSGQSLTLTRIPGPLPWHNSGEPITLLLIALAFWGIGTLVRLYKPGDSLAARFFRLDGAIALALAMAPASGADVVWAKAVSAAAFALLPAWFLDFFLRFARGDQPGVAARRATGALYASGAAAGILYVAAGMANSSAYYTLRSTLLGLLALGIFGGLGALVQALVRPASPESRQQLTIVLLGAGLASLPFTTLAVIPVSLGFEAIVRPQVAALGTILLPATIAYAILRRRFLGIDIAVERALVYGTTAILLSVCYALVLYGLGAVGNGPAAFPQSGPVLSVLFFAAITLTFVPVRDRMRLLIDRLIYRDRYDYAWLLRELGSRLASARPMDEALGEVASALARAMNLRGAAVFVRHPVDGLRMQGAAGECREERIAGSLQEAAASLLRPGTAAPEGSGRWIPLAAHGEENGFLYLGPKETSVEFSAEDLSLAETIAGQAAVAVANALLVERLGAKVTELELLRDRLLHVQEEERKHLAEELHDGPLHTVMDLVRRAEVRSGGTAPDGLAEQIHDLAERGMDAAHELRTICSDLYPSELAHLGLAPALQGLANRISREEDILVRFSRRRFPEDRRLPAQVEDTLYRVAREAVDNVCRHARASTADVVLAWENGGVTLTIRDDGQGFAVPDSSVALLRTGHLGLATMRERVEQLRGMMVVVSEPGSGTEIRVRVPVSSAQRGDLPALLPGAGR